MAGSSRNSATGDAGDRGRVKIPPPVASVQLSLGHKPVVALQPGGNEMPSCRPLGPKYVTLSCMAVSCSALLALAGAAKKIALTLAAAMSARVPARSYKNASWATSKGACVVQEGSLHTMMGLDMPRPSATTSDRYSPGCVACER